MRKILLLSILQAVLAFSICAEAARKRNVAWPSEPVRIMVGWSAGGTSDVVTRALAGEMSKQLGRKIFVTNVTGALGAICGAQVAAGPADGHLLFGGAAVHGTWPILGHSRVSWTDFYAFLGVMYPTTIYVMQDAPWKTLADLIADIEVGPKGRFKYGHPGTGSNGNIFAALVLGAAGVEEKVVSIPYKGGREAGRYLLSKETQFASVSSGDLVDWAVAGRIRPLANLFHEDIVFEGITFPSIVTTYPKLKSYQAINPYIGIYVGRKTPPEIVTKIAETFAEAIRQKQFQKIAVKERAAVLMPLIGRAADEQMSKIESARGWALFELGVAPHSPAEFGVPKLEQWRWPPHARAAALQPWPAEVENISRAVP
ncbi:MAG: tripartite tricarboxylate transporter substrate binding protein [Phycisphaerales bacterium]|nr:MAG: tripartite tricarboxylate transporter substrate binding protein [Phycisphaerales bacterium]